MFPSKEFLLPSFLFSESFASNCRQMQGTRQMVATKVRAQLALLSLDQQTFTEKYIEKITEEKTRGREDNQTHKDKYITGKY